MCDMPILGDQGVHSFLDDDHSHKRFIISNTFSISQSPLGQFDWTGGVLELLREFVETFDLWQMLLSSNLILWNHTLSSLSGVGHWISPRSARIIFHKVCSHTSWCRMRKSDVALKEKKNVKKEKNHKSKWIGTKIFLKGWSPRREKCFKPLLFSSLQSF